MAARTSILTNLSELRLPLQPSAPASPPKHSHPASFASFMRILPQTDRLQIARHLAQEKGKIKSAELLSSMLSQVQESPKLNLSEYTKLRNIALSKLGFSLDHNIITKRPPVPKNHTPMEIERSKAAIYCCILTRDDEIVHELTRHFRLNDDAVQDCAHDAATTEIRHGRYLSAMEIADAYKLDNIRQKLNSLGILFAKIDRNRHGAMFGPLNEGDGSG